MYYLTIKDRWTTKEGKRLLRLPLYYKLSEEDIHKIVKAIEKFMVSL